MSFFFASVGYSEVFVKEIPYRIRKFMDAGTLDDVIPRDYVHAFLIRDPVKTMPSHLKLWLDLRCWPTGRTIKFLGFKEGKPSALHRFMTW